MSEEKVDLVPPANSDESIGANPEETAQNPQPEQVDENGKQVDKPEEKKPEDEHKERENRIQKRFDKLTREKYELKGRVDTLERMIAAIQQGGQNQQPSATGKPTRDQYGSDEDYIEALTDWKLEQKTAGIEQRLTQKQNDKKSIDSFEDKIANAVKEYDDFEEVYEDLQTVNIKVPNEVNMAIQKSQYSADILYFLGKNLSEAKALARMDAIDGIARIGEIAAEIKADKKAKAAPPSKPIPKAPAPINPVKGTGESGGWDHLKNPEKYTAEEWRLKERERVEKLNKR